MAPLGSLIERYAEAASAHGIATERGDFERANYLHDQIIAAFREITALGDPGWLALRKGLTASDASVRCWVATHMLKTEPAAAIPVLEHLAVEGGLIGLSAATVLEQWRNGTFEWA